MYWCVKFKILSSPEYTDEEGVRWVLEKPKPNFMLITPDCINNKSKHNHFIRHTDVKPKGKTKFVMLML